MKISIMQPYFFPHLGIYDLIDATDFFVVFDTVKYQRKSWMNRNRILHPNHGWQYVSVPVQVDSSENAIKEITIIDKQGALDKILGQTDHYKKHAPFFNQTKNLIISAFDHFEGNSLVDLNIATLAVVCEYLGKPFDWAKFSKLNLELPTIEHAGQWALEISSALGAREYINPPGGEHLSNASEWVAKDIDLKFIQTPQFSYDCGPFGFEEQLSIINVLMWNSAKKIDAAIQDKKFKSAKSPSEIYANV